MSEESSLPDSVYELDYFRKEGFVRQTCEQCGDMFWTRDSTRTVCGEPPCGEYTFIGTENLSDPFSIEEVRESFLSFFETNGHDRVAPYPVAANRWRDDVLLTQASIYDFQPLVTSGETPPPANPLCVSQPCIRMNDIENVGKTGRHTTAFEMLGHHAFNAKADADAAYEGEVYWKEETIAHCDAFFEHMGADLNEVVYIEDPWVGGGNAGPAFEVIYKGLELATLVFMSLEEDPNGSYQLKDGKTYSEMDTYVVDTGYGLERWAWVAQGTATVYEAVYPDLIEVLKNDIGLTYTDEETRIVTEASLRAGRLDMDSSESLDDARAAIADDIGVSQERLVELLEPLERIYAITDHTRALAYMLGDEIIPSSNGTGYLVRQILRRTVRFLDEINASIELSSLVEKQATRLGYDNRDHIKNVIEAELAAYQETQRHGREHVQTLVERYAERGEIPTEEVTELYQSYGLRPETVQTLVGEYDDQLSVALPDTLGTDDIADDTDTTAPVSGVEYDDTELLFYEDQTRTQFEATIQDIVKYDDALAVVLDKTVFYPEGGGQPADTGELRTDTYAVSVVDVQKHDGTVFHIVETPIETAFDEATTITGQINEERREAHMQHHTATHLVGHAARNVLGNHIKQAGARKGTTEARLDITHYKTPSSTELEAIESHVNKLVRENRPVSEQWVERRDAEDIHGFSIYQGGVPSGETLRLITVGDDVQACAGTHVSETGQIGTVVITDVTTVRDGVIRLTFAAADAAVSHIQTQRQLLSDSAETFEVPPDELPSTAERFFTEWKEQRDRINDLQEEVSRLRIATQETSFTLDDGTGVVVERLDRPTDELVPMANAVAQEGRIAVLATVDDSVSVIVQTPESHPMHAGDVARELASYVGGGGGGDETVGQGGGPDTGAVDILLEKAASVLTQ